jgi:RimJ/RimL family protein N-acetyltransferase
MNPPPGYDRPVLRGEKVYLRAREEPDAPVLHRGLYDDVAQHARADGRPWRPRPASTGSPYDPKAPGDGAAIFSVVAVDGDALLGDALLWSIDLHNRCAHIGISLLPAARGRGAGTETLTLLAGYGFDVLGLHRLQLETLADNEAMIGAARRAGFEHEATLRESAWVLGAFADEVIMALLADDWRSRS